MNFTQINHVDFYTSSIQSYKLFLCYKTLVKEFPTLHIESHFIKISISTKKSRVNIIKNIFSVLDITCELHESSDEWFYIESVCRGVKTWYKCDQVEGVIDCLKQIYSI